MHESSGERAVATEADLSPPEMQVLMVHLLRSPVVINAAIDKLTPDHLSPELYPHDVPNYLIWAIASNYYTRFRTPIPQSLLHAEVASHMLADDAYAPFGDAIFHLINLAYSWPESELQPEPVIALYLQRLLNVRVFRGAIDEMRKMSPEDAFNHLRNTYDRSRVATARKVSLFDTEDASVSENAVVPVQSGCVLIDRLIGGIRPKHMTGILAPFAGGKTMAQIEAAVQCAKQKIPVVMFEYEQDPRLLRPRIWSCATGISTKLLTETKFSDLPDDLKNKVKSLAYMDDYLHVIDMQCDTAGTGGAREVVTVLQQYIGNGFRPQLVCIDWLGIMVDRWCQSNDKTDSYDRISAYKNFMAAFRYDVANAMECEVLIAHQLNATAGSKGPNSRATTYDAADFKSFAALVDSCLMIGAKAANGIATVRTGKNRGADVEVNVRVNSDLCRFEIVGSGFMTITDNAGRELLVRPDGTGAEGELHADQAAVAGFE